MVSFLARQRNAPQPKHAVQTRICNHPTLSAVFTLRPLNCSILRAFFKARAGEEDRRWILEQVAPDASSDERFLLLAMALAGRRGLSFSEMVAKGLLGNRSAPKRSRFATRSRSTAGSSRVRASTLRGWAGDHRSATASTQHVPTPTPPPSTCRPTTRCFSPPCSKRIWKVPGPTRWPQTSGAPTTSLWGSWDSPPPTPWRLPASRRFAARHWPPS